MIKTQKEIHVLVCCHWKARTKTVFMSLPLRCEVPRGIRKSQNWINNFSRFVSLRFHRVHGAALPYTTLQMYGSAFVRDHKLSLSPLISEPPRSLAIKIQQGSRGAFCLTWDEAPRGVGGRRWQAGSSLGREQRGEQESAEVHANAATALIKRDASRFSLWWAYWCRAPPWEIQYARAAVGQWSEGASEGSERKKGGRVEREGRRRWRKTCLYRRG